MVSRKGSIMQLDVYHYDMFFLCTGVVDSKLALPLIQRKNGKSADFYRMEEYEFKQLFEPPIDACNSFYIEIQAQKATRLGRLLDPGW
jgi:hypothetical protein